MSFRITVSIFKTTPNARFHPAEQTIWKAGNGGTWSIADDEHILTMNGSGTSGCLRFVADTGEIFIAAFGVHNDKRWCDIVANLAPDETALVIHPQYYEQHSRKAVRKKQLSSCSVNNSHGRTFAIDFTVAEGSELKANLIIG